jgi:prepilin-type processing-associated H-X9-DG protein
MEETALYNSYDSKARVDDEANAATMRTPIETYACPSRRPPAADRNFDNNEAPPIVLGAATLADYAAAAGISHMTGMVGSDESAAVFGQFDRKDAGPIFSGSRISARQVEDGLSKTLAIGERHLPPVPEGTPENMAHLAIGDTAAVPGDTPTTTFRGTEKGLATGPDDTDATKFGSTHSTNLVQFVFLDGHVRGLRPDIALAVLKALSTISGAEIVPDED